MDLEHHEGMRSVESDLS